MFLHLSVNRTRCKAKNLHTEIKKSTEKNILEAIIKLIFTEILFLSVINKSQGEITVQNIPILSTERKYFMLFSLIIYNTKNTRLTNSNPNICR